MIGSTLPSQGRKGGSTPLTRSTYFGVGKCIKLIAKMENEIRISAKGVLAEIAGDLGSRAAKLQSLGHPEAADILRVLASQVRQDSNVLPKIRHLREILG